MMKKNRNALQGLENLLPQLSRQRGWEEQLDMHSIFVHWHELVDSEMAKHCQPLKIVKKVLWLEVENSAWLQQFQFQTVLLLDIFNKSLHLSKLEGLRFCIAEKEKREEKTEPSLRYVKPQAQDLDAFERQAASITDDEVRESLVRLWYLSKACRKE